MDIVREQLYRIKMVAAYHKCVHHAEAFLKTLDVLHYITLKFKGKQKTFYSQSEHPFLT